MKILKPFQGVFRGQNRGGSTPSENSPIVLDSCEEGGSARAPDPTPTTMQNGGGVGSPSLGTDSVLCSEVRVILTKRDEAILALCFEQQFVTKEHIEIFFKGCSQRRVNFRIQKLVEGGFLKRENYSDSPFSFVYRLTPRGRKKVRQLEVKTRSVITRLNPRTIYHDALVTHCRLRLADIWDADFFPERALKEIGLPEIPDGLWKFSSGKRVALEVECSDKGRSRFLNRLTEFDRIEALTFVLYVTSSEKMFGIVRKYLVEGYSEQPAGVVRWEELETGCPKVDTVHGLLDLFSTRSM